MRLPQVSERIKEAPAQALRGVFAGIGQLLLITDKLRNKTPADQQVPQARAPEPSVQDPGSAAPVPVPSPAPAPVPSPAPAPAPVAETTASAPLPNYDELSIASLRARLRNLDVAQLRQLLVYEQAHAARPDVMAMFERRITKLESEGADERGEATVEAEAEAQEDAEADVQAEEAEAVEDES
jgi:hypothetical protein